MADRPTAIEAALREIVSVLGPSHPKGLTCAAEPPHSSSPRDELGCQGCQYEWNHARQLAQEALALQPTPPQSAREKAEAIVEQWWCVQAITDEADAKDGLTYAIAAALADRQADTDRLDWLESNHDSWAFDTGVLGTTLSGWKRRDYQAGAESARAAIDAARLASSGSGKEGREDG